jgi:hypothetical protein
VAKNQLHTNLDCGISSNPKMVPYNTQRSVAVVNLNAIDTMGELRDIPLGSHAFNIGLQTVHSVKARTLVSILGLLVKDLIRKLVHPLSGLFNQLAICFYIKSNHVAHNKLLLKTTYFVNAIFQVLHIKHKTPSYANRSCPQH